MNKRENTEFFYHNNYQFKANRCIIVVMETKKQEKKKKNSKYQNSTKSKSRISKNINFFWLLLAVIACISLYYIVFKSEDLGMFYVKTLGSPKDSVSSFYEALLAKDYETACSYLDDYDALGLMDIPDTPEGQLIFNALKDSYSYNIISEPVIDKLTATQRVSFTFLDIKAVEKDTSLKIDPILEDKVQSLPREQLFDENNNYLPELINDVYLEALSSTLANPSDYYITKEYDIEMEYKNNKWMIKTNAEMLNGLLGGIL